MGCQGREKIEEVCGGEGVGVVGFGEEEEEEERKRRFVRVCV